MTLSSSVGLCCGSQTGSLVSLACFTQWQLTSDCCNSCTSTCCRQGVKKDTRKKGSLYLCAPVSGGGSWGVAEQREKYRMCTDLHRPTPGTSRKPHLQREQHKRNTGKCFHSWTWEAHIREMPSIMVDQPGLNDVAAGGACIFAVPLTARFEKANGWHFASDSTTINSRSWQEGLYQGPC